MDYQTGSAGLFASAVRETQMAYAIRPMTGEVIIVKFGEKGFYQTDYGCQSRDWVDEQNSKIGIDEPTAMAFEVCSMFGNWDKFNDIREQMKAKVIHVG